MKSALVLGLALTASAFSTDQYDNELIIAPTDQFGNIKNYPRNIRFDEQADDEFRVRPGFLQVADDELRIASLDEFARKKTNLPNIRSEKEGNDLFSFEIPRYHNLTNRFAGTFLDDEYVMAPLDGTEKFHRQRKFDDVATRKGYDDEGDNELAFSPFRTTVYNNEADDELIRGPYRRRRRSVDSERRKEFDNEYAVRAKAAAAKKYRPGLVEHVKNHPGTVFFDEDDELVARPSYLQIADDELIRPPSKNKNKNKNKGNVVYGKEADDELYNDYKMSSKLFVERSAEALRRDDEVDDKLHYTPPILGVIHIAANKLIGALSNKKPVGKVMHDDEIDDELLVRPVVPYVAADDELSSFMSTKLFTERQAKAAKKNDEPHNTKKIGPKLFVQRQAEALRRDDEFDDELAWLDGLLQEAPYNGAIFRAFDDDELRFEKFGQLKGQKSNEMPEIRGKVRPLGDGSFLPFNQ